MVELTKKFNSCTHKDAFYYNQDRDEFEGRVYDLIYCPNCESFWEERCRLDKHTYPKGGFFVK